MAFRNPVKKVHNPVNIEVNNHQDNPGVHHFQGGYSKTRTRDKYFILYISR